MKWKFLSKDKIEDMRDDPKEMLTLQKEIYIQSQHWARHNETLIIATNTVLLGAVAAIFTIYFRNSPGYKLGIFLLPLIISLLGLVATTSLSRQYRDAISRLVVYENFFGMHKENKDILKVLDDYPTLKNDWGNSFVPECFHQPLTRPRPPSTFFFIVHTVIFAFSWHMLFDVSKLVWRIRTLINCIALTFLELFNIFPTN